MYGFEMTDEARAAVERRDRWRKQAAEQAGTLLFETAGEDSTGNSYLFRSPVRIMTADDALSLSQLFAELTLALQAGFYVAGFLRYEAGYVLERVRNRGANREPLAWFGIYQDPEIAAKTPATRASLLPQPLCVHMETSLPDYLHRVASIQHYIDMGDTYQVNLTTALESSYRGELLHLYEALAAQQPAPFSALLHLPEDELVLSFSPELFFSVSADRTITVRPMKGTAALPETEDGDQKQIAWLATDEKNRAEHLMIVDLLRSDLGRLCTMGSVVVDHLFDVERYRTLLQMTSTMSGSLRTDVGLLDIFRALFPSGSMTGAPKPRTMEVLAELETKPRGIYSGAIGFAAPDGSAVFNVAIRTLVLRDGMLRMGVGGGIVADSVAQQEHAECWLKSEFLLRASPPFSLLESVLWDDGFRLLDQHLDRLANSAEQLNFMFQRAKIMDQVLAFVRGLRGPQKIRIVLYRKGEVSLTASEAIFWRSPLRVRLSPRRTWSKDSFLRHKTTFRPIYDEGTREAEELNFADTLFANERDELTEGSISSLLLLMNGRWKTPALASGVLPGVARTQLLGRKVIEEQVLTLDALTRAEGVALCNGVRGVGVVRSLTMDDGRILEFPTSIRELDLL